MTEEFLDQTLEHLVKRAAAGEEKALSLLLVSFHPLIKRNAIDLAGGDTFLFDDLYQEGMVALCRAVVRFESERGAFPSFARQCVRNAMISHLRKKPREVLVDDFDERMLVDWARDGFQGVEIRDDLRLLLEVLTPLETAVLDAFLQTGGVASAVRVLGWPRKKVENALSRIRRKHRDRQSSENSEKEASGQSGLTPLT